MQASDICITAADLVIGAREDQHGNKTENFTNIAKLIGAYLDIEISAVDVAMIMVLVKMARTKTGDFNIDDFIDMVGYAACGAEIASKKAGFAQSARKTTMDLYECSEDYSPGLTA